MHLRHMRSMALLAVLPLVMMTPARAQNEPEATEAAIHFLGMVHAAHWSAGAPVHHTVHRKVSLPACNHERF
jgi:hypothetical protein